MQKLKSIALVLFAVPFLFLGCNSSEQSDKIVIVTTTGIIGDCISEIVKDQAEVISLMGAGVDPHLYKATQGDIAKLSEADIIVYNGLHLEGKMAKMLENYAKQKSVFALGDFVTQEDLKRVDDKSDLVDPHIWFSPSLWSQGIIGVAKELSKIEGLEGTDKNAELFGKKILDTKSDLKAILDSNLTSERRILITSHDAFSYFGDAFGFRVRGLQGVSTAAEYGAKDVKDLIDFIIDNQIKSVFVETSVNDKNLFAVIEGANARGYELNIGGTLHSDALGAANSMEGTYLGMLNANVKTIIAGLK